MYLFQIQKSFKFYHNFNITIYAKNVVRLYDCMRQPDNSKLSMEVRLLEKIYHPSSNSNLSTPIHKQKGRILDLKAGYCNAIMGNDKIDSICSLSSPRCSNVKVMNIFNNTPRRKWSHGHHQSTSSTWSIYIHSLLLFAQKILGMHHIIAKLYSLPLSQLHSLYTTCLSTLTTDPYFNLYKVTAIILDIGHYRLFKAVTIRGNEKKNRPFLPPFFANKGLDTINLGNIQYH